MPTRGSGARDLHDGRDRARIAGLRLEGGAEILTSDEEHPGLLGALVAARELQGVSVREVPLARIAEEIGPNTRLIACCHVGWMSGTHAPADLAQADVLVLLDGAQGAGAVPVDVAALGCDAYAAAGQKWLCGPDGTGMLFVHPELRERLGVDRRGYGNMEDPGAGLGARLHADARRFDALGLNGETLALAVAAFDFWPGPAGARSSSALRTSPSGSPRCSRARGARSRRAPAGRSSRSRARIPQASANASRAPASCCATFRSDRG